MGNSSTKEYSRSEKFGYRILSVKPSSPASNLGLVYFFDFIVTANGQSLHGKDIIYFSNLIKEFEERELILGVYNCKNQTLRELSVVPSRKWEGGGGSLGIEIRYDCCHDVDGYLCRVLHVETNSPADIAGLSPSSDYILGTMELTFTDTDLLENELLEQVDKKCTLFVYNSIRDEVRVTVAIPSRNWNVNVRDLGGKVAVFGADVACGVLHRLPKCCTDTIGFSTIGNMRP